MKTTKKQRDGARKGCEFWLMGKYCISHFCTCMKALKDELKEKVAK